jgi:hypothetical protein
MQKEKCFSNLVGLVKKWFYSQFKLKWEDFDAERTIVPYVR